MCLNVRQWDRTFYAEAISLKKRTIKAVKAKIWDFGSINFFESEMIKILSIQFTFVV